MSSRINMFEIIAIVALIAFAFARYILGFWLVWHFSHSWWAILGAVILMSWTCSHKKDD